MMQFIGRLHPALVHLPIGILLLGCLFQWLSASSAYKKLQPAVPITLFWGMLSAILSCITGYILSNEGDYAGSTVNLHQWMGISVAVVAIVLYLLHRRSVNAGFAKWISLLLVILIVIAGHLGATLTHGENFLSNGLAAEAETPIARKAIPDAQAALLYKDIIQPLLQEKCNSCHGPNKQKGKLRLDNPDMIMKGGKEGNDVVAGQPDQSELIKRIMLARNEEHHMPPKDKPQLTPQEITLLHWWIESGAHFDKQVKDLPQPENVKPALLALQQSSTAPTVKASELPTAPTEPANANAIAALKKRGIMVLPVAQNSNYLHANFVTVDSFTPKDLELLLPLKKQLLWLKLSNQPVTDSSLKTIAQLGNLTRLQVDRTKITDSGLSFLQPLQQLRYLNLVGNNVSFTGLEKLQQHKQLQSLYLYQTNMNADDWSKLKKILPTVLLDSGGYKLPMLPSDTTVVTEKNKYNPKATDPQ